MENKFAEQYLSLEDSLFDDFDLDNLEAVFPRMEKRKELADKSGVWKYRVDSRMMLIKMGYEFDYLERSMGELIWLVGQWEMNKEESHLEEAMIMLERFIEYLPAFPKVARRDIDRAIESLKGWFATTSREPHYLDWALFKTYSKLGEKDLTKKYHQQLLDLEAVNPFGFKSDSLSACKTCSICRKIHYYSSIGLLDKAMEITEPLLEDDVDPCLTSPRTGLSYILDAYLDAGRVAEASLVIPTLTQHLRMPTRAPLRIVTPLLRYYLETGNQAEVAKIMDEYSAIVDGLADRWAVNKYLDLIPVDHNSNGTESVPRKRIN